MIKKLLASTVAVSLLTTAVFGAGGAGSNKKTGELPLPAISAKSAILINADSGEVYYGKSERERLPMASTTKIMTAIIALEYGDLEKSVTVSERACGVEGSSIYLYPNEKLSLLDLVYAVMLESANDAATAVAIEISGSSESFAVLMNEKAKELSLTDTSFTNPHGLDNIGHYTTAYDLSMLTKYAMENETFCEVVSTYKKEIPLKNDEGTRLLINHNRLLRSVGGVCGVKTGYTTKSGRCLVSAAERDNTRLICVTLNAPDDWTDHEKLLEYGFGSYITRRLAEPGEYSFSVPIVNGAVGSVVCSNAEGFSETVRRSDITSEKIKAEVELNRFYYAPVSAGEVLGYVKFYNGKKLICALALTAESAADKAGRDGFLVKLWKDFKNIFQTAG